MPVGNYMSLIVDRKTRTMSHTDITFAVHGENINLDHMIFLGLTSKSQTPSGQEQNDTNKTGNTEYGSYFIALVD